jgi:hypothetical protein
VSVAAILPLAGVSGYLVRDPPRVLEPINIPAAVESVEGRLGLNLEAKGDGFNVRWSPESPLVVDAASGKLIITEPGQPAQIINLDGTQLHKGRLYIRSAASLLEFRFQVLHRKGRLDTETILAFSETASDRWKNFRADTNPEKRTRRHSAATKKASLRSPAVEAENSGETDRQPDSVEKPGLGFYWR